MSGKYFNLTYLRNGRFRIGIDNFAVKLPKYVVRFCKWLFQGRNVVEYQSFVASCSGVWWRTCWLSVGKQIFQRCIKWRRRSWVNRRFFGKNFSPNMFSASNFGCQPWRHVWQKMGHSWSKAEHYMLKDNYTYYSLCWGQPWPQTRHLTRHSDQGAVYNNGQITENR